MQYTQELQLNQTIIGIGNSVHDQYHRSNRMAMNPELLNQAMTEKFHGGIQPSTISELACMSGELSANHYGVINVEDGWNSRRGLCIMRMTVTSNSLQTKELAILGYLKGGSDVYLGVVPDDVLFVPVRSYMTVAESTQTLDYMPDVKKQITDSSQFLMPDPGLMNNLASIRPVDVINYGIGQAEHTETDAAGEYAGTVNSSLNNQGIVISKGRNLSSIENAQSLLSHARRVSNSANQYNELSENMAAEVRGIGDAEVYHNEFLAAMMSHLQMEDYSGFIGFSFGELRSVFPDFDSTIPKINLTNSVSEVNHTLTSEQMGSADYREKMSNELAFICFYALIECGLLSLNFVASNCMVGRGLIGNGDIYWEAGVNDGMNANDSLLFSRTEQMRTYIEKSFFRKYSGAFGGNHFNITADVKAGVAKETVVKISLDNDPATEKEYTIPGYCINRTSPNIANGEVQKQTAISYLDNVSEYFAAK